MRVFSWVSELVRRLARRQRALHGRRLMNGCSWLGGALQGCCMTCMTFASSLYRQAAVALHMHVISTLMYMCRQRASSTQYVWCGCTATQTLHAVGATAAPDGHALSARRVCTTCLRLSALDQYFILVQALVDIRRLAVQLLLLHTCAGAKNGARNFVKVYKAQSAAQQAHLLLCASAALISTLASA